MFTDIARFTGITSGLMFPLPSFSSSAVVPVIICNRSNKGGVLVLNYFQFSFHMKSQMLFKGKAK